MEATVGADVRARRRVAARAALLTALLVGPLLGGCAPAPQPGPTLADRPGAVAEPGTETGRQEAPLPEPSAGTAARTSESRAVTPERTGSRVGALAEAFPLDLLPVPDDAALLVSSAAPVGASADVHEVSLTLRSALSVGDLVDLYRDALTTAGFTEATPAGTGPTADATFSRSGGDELVTIGVVDLDDVRTLTLGGRVRTGDGG